MGLPTDLHMVCFYNLTGRRGKIDVANSEDKYHPDYPPAALACIQKLQRPCLAYKILAAGRRDPREAFTDAFGGIKDTDAVVVGVFPKDQPTQIADDAKLALEALGEPAHT